MANTNLLDPADTKAKLKNLERIDSMAAGIDAADISSIFALFLKETTRLLFEHTLKYVLGPIAVAMNIIRMCASWRKYHLQKNNNVLSQAIIESIAAAAVTVAIGGSIFFSALFSVAAPAIFVSLLSLKTVYCLGHAIHDSIEMQRNDNTLDKQHYKKQAILHGLFAGALATITVGIGLSMIGHYFTLAALAVAGGIGATFVAGYRFLNTFKKEEAYTRITNEENELGGLEQQKKIHHRLRFNHRQKPSSEKDLSQPREVRFAKNAPTELFKVARATPVDTSVPRKKRNFTL